MKKNFTATSLIKFSILSFLAFPLISCEAEELPFEKDASTDEIKILTHDLAPQSSTTELKEAPEDGGGGDPEGGGGFNFPDDPADYDPSPDEDDNECWGLDCDNEDPPSGGDPEPEDGDTTVQYPTTDFEHEDDVDSDLS